MRCGPRRWRRRRSRCRARPRRTRPMRPAPARRPWLTSRCPRRAGPRCSITASTISRSFSSIAWTAMPSSIASITSVTFISSSAAYAAGLLSHPRPPPSVDNRGSPPHAYPLLGPCKFPNFEEKRCHEESSTRFPFARPLQGRPPPSSRRGWAPSTRFPFARPLQAGMRRSGTGYATTSTRFPFARPLQGLSQMV